MSQLDSLAVVIIIVTVFTCLTHTLINVQPLTTHFHFALAACRYSGFVSAFLLLIRDLFTSGTSENQQPTTNGILSQHTETTTSSTPTAACTI